MIRLVQRLSILLLATCLLCGCATTSGEVGRFTFQIRSSADSTETTTETKSPWLVRTVAGIVSPIGSFIPDELSFCIVKWKGCNHDDHNDETPGPVPVP